MVWQNLPLVPKNVCIFVCTVIAHPQNAIRTRNRVLAGNSSAEVFDSAGTARAIGWNVMPRVDIGAATVRTLTIADAGSRFRMQSNTGFMNLGNIGDESAVNAYVTSALGAGIRVPAGTLMRYYGGSGGQQDFNGPVDVMFEGGAAFTVVQFGNLIFEAWGGQLQ